MIDYVDYEEIAEEAGFTHKSQLPDLDSVRDHLLGVVEALYVTGSVKALESSLEEVCHELAMPFISGRPMLEKRRLRDMLEYGRGYQDGIIDSSRGE